jgi:hypothetical protein
MDSDDSNISNHVGDLDNQPYQFKPLCNDESQQEREQLMIIYHRSHPLAHVTSRNHVTT